MKYNNNELEELIKGHEDFFNEDISDEDWDKVQGIIEAGAKIEIKWKGRQETDSGYLFALPESDVEISDIYVHVNQVSNEDGIGDADDVWINLYQLVNNDQVKWIKVK